MELPSPGGQTISLPQARPPVLPNGPARLYKTPGHDPNRAPLRNRTVDLLLTIYPRADAVAICDDAGQVRGGARCCRPTYLVITRGPGGPDGALLAGALAAISPNPGHAVQPPPRAQGATASARTPRCWRRPRPGPGTCQARQPQARCCSLAYLPAHRQPGRPARPAPGNQPNALPQPPAPHPSARPGPAGHQTRPRHPARPARVDRICRLCR
jgi:hypothetical protein